MKEKKSPLNTTLVTQHPMGLAATRLTTLQSSLVVVEKRLEMNTLYTILDLPKNETIIAQFKPTAAVAAALHCSK
jgi:hypothetical protein